MISEHQSASTQNTDEPWQILEGSWHSGNANFLPYFYLVMENVDRGRAIIDYVSIEEDLGGGEFGPNILPKPWMSHHLYFVQRNSLAFDKVIEATHQHDIFLKLTTLEKNEWTLSRIQWDGGTGDFGEKIRIFTGISGRSPRFAGCNKLGGDTFRPVGDIPPISIPGNCSMKAIRSTVNITL